MPEFKSVPGIPARMSGHKISLASSPIPGCFLIVYHPGERASDTFGRIFIPIPLSFNTAARHTFYKISLQNQEHNKHRDQ